MAFGWKTEYEKRVNAEGLSNWEVFSIAEQACKDLDWEYLVVDEKTFTATTPTHWTLAEEIITLVVDGEEIIFKSQSESLDLYEAGRNKKNIEDHLLPAFNKIKKELQFQTLQEHANAIKTETLRQLKTGNRVTAEKTTYGVSDHEITFALIVINIVVFGIMAARGVNIHFPSPVDITKWGGNVKFNVDGGEWWRLITNIFIHIGIVPLIVNLFGLYFIGLIVESILGKLKFLVAFLGTGVMASLVSILWVPEGVTAGSSGAVFGLFGVFAAFLTTRYVNKRLPVAIWVGNGLYLVYTFIYGIHDVIDYSTIIGGFGAGLFIGYLFYFFHFNRNLARAGGTRITVEVILITGLLIFFYLRKYGRDDSLRFEKAVMKLNQIELKAMTQMQRLQSAESNKDAARVLSDSAMPEWRHFQQELVKTDKYTLDEQFKRKRKLLNEYAGLRIRQTELIYKSVQEETQQYDAEINEVSEKIDKIIDQLGE